MSQGSVVYACVSDLAGKIRGKGFPAADLEKRARRGIGWAPTNAQITCFDAIAESPFGALGDMLIRPDAQTRVNLRDQTLGLDEDFALSDIVDMDGNPWSCCTRSILRSALDRLERVAGLSLLSTFEHEFQFKSGSAPLGSAYTLDGFRQRRSFCERLIAAMALSGLDPDTVMREFGADQYEITMGPAVGLASADNAVIVRELARALARARGEEVTFSPLSAAAGVGNGVHIHMSFLDKDGVPATYDADGPHGLSKTAQGFVAGILKYVDAILALTAPSAISYLRLTPHRWSAAFNNLGVQDREAALRICHVSAVSDLARAKQFNFEFRAADAAASPHLQLAAIVHAGVQGIEDGLSAPEATAEDLSLLSPEALERRGLRRFPDSLEAALSLLEGNETVRSWFPEGFTEIYLAHKRGELAFLKDKPMEDVLSAYAAVY